MDNTRCTKSQTHGVICLQYTRANVMSHHMCVICAYITCMYKMCTYSVYICIHIYIHIYICEFSCMFNSCSLMWVTCCIRCMPGIFLSSHGRAWSRRCRAAHGALVKTFWLAAEGNRVSWVFTLISGWTGIHSSFLIGNQTFSFGYSIYPSDQQGWSHFKAWTWGEAASVRGPRPFTLVAELPRLRCLWSP